MRRIKNFRCADLRAALKRSLSVPQKFNFQEAPARMLNGQHVIYCLCEPETGEPRYIGKCSNPGARLFQHLSRNVVSTAKWIDELLAVHTIPLMCELERCEPHKSLEYERYWILHLAYSSIRCLNHEARALAISKRVHSQPEAQEPWSNIPTDIGKSTSDPTGSERRGSRPEEQKGS